MRSHKNEQIISNSLFVYHPKSTVNVDNRVSLNQAFEPALQLRHNNDFKFLPGMNVIRQPDSSLNAFERAAVEERQLKEKKEEEDKLFVVRYNTILAEMNKELRHIKEKEIADKRELEEVLTRIIKKVLKFSKKNSPALAMINSKVAEAMNTIKKETGKSVLNLSTGSLNLSYNSTISQGSKYESNAFLRLLGLDLTNLTPANIKIDIDMAWDFISRWKVPKDKINETIRKKVVYEIMNVEERRSVRKVEKLNKKVNDFLLKKKAERRKKLADTLKNADVENITLEKHDTTVQDRQKKALERMKEKEKERKTRKKKESQNSKDVPKKKVKLHSYDNLEKICKYIKESEDLIENEAIVNHYSNLLYCKKMTKISENVKKKNTIELTKGPSILNQFDALK